MIYLLVIVAAIWFGFTLLALRNLNAAPLLPQCSPSGIATGPVPLPCPAELPRVSVVIAARNEEARIEQAVRQLLAQSGVQLEVIAVNDRSTDGTRAILDRLAATDPRVRPLHLEELPPGWLGKCHACGSGAALATSPWILFTDGDIHMAPDVIARAVAAADQQSADHVTLLPGLDCTDSLTRAALLAWTQCLLVYAPASQINADRGKRGMGVGAFNLVRRTAYDAIGGHERLRMEIVDDVKLGLLLRRGGFRQRVYDGFRDIEAQWANSLAGAIRAVEKNWFAGIGFSVPLSFLTIVGLLTITVVGLVGPLVDDRWGWLALAGVCSPIVPAILIARRSHWPVGLAVLAPLGFIVFVVAGLHSTWKTLRQGGVRWRDTFYPLSELRAGLVR